MNSSSRKDRHEKAPFVFPGLRPSPEEPSRRRTYTGLVFLVLGFACMLFGSSSVVGQLALIAGFGLVWASFYTLRVFGFGLRRQRTKGDIRKLYGTKNT